MLHWCSLQVVNEVSVLMAAVHLKAGGGRILPFANKFDFFAGFWATTYPIHKWQAARSWGLPQPCLLLPDFGRVQRNAQLCGDQRPRRRWRSERCHPCMWPRATCPTWIYAHPSAPQPAWGDHDPQERVWYTAHHWQPWGCVGYGWLPAAQGTPGRWHAAALRFAKHFSVITAIPHRDNHIGHRSWLLDEGVMERNPSPCAHPGWAASVSERGHLWNPAHWQDTF